MRSGSAGRRPWETRALQAGKNIRWVADQLGHADPSLTLRVYAHAMREEENDLSFLEFGGTKRHPDGTKPSEQRSARKAPPASDRRTMRKVARREGFEPPTLRFEDCSWGFSYPLSYGKTGTYVILDLQSRRIS